jgi:hypothetical protein
MTGNPVTYWRLGRYFCPSCTWWTRVVIKQADVEQIMCPCGMLAIEGHRDDD